MTELRGKVVLVTGAGGFVGPYALRALAARGARLHGTGGPPPRDAAPLEAWHDSDLRDPESLALAISEAEPDCVLHLAGQASAGRSFEQPAETFHVNALGTWHLLEAMRIHVPRARALIVTSGEIYGAQPSGTRVAEDSTQRPVSPYGISKAAADAFGAIAAGRGQDVVRARSFGHTGPGQEARFVIPTVAQQIAAAEAGRAEPVIRVGNLAVTRDLLDVRDVADAYVALLERGHGGQAYNVCRGVPLELSQVVRDLVAQARLPMRVETDPARLRPSDVPYLVGDPSRLTADTGWQASMPWERTLADVLEWWRQAA